MITKDEFKTNLWPEFWKAFPKATPQQAERIGPFYYEAFKHLEYKMLEKAFHWLLKHFKPTYSEPLPAISTINQQVLSYSERRSIQQHEKIKNEERKPPPKVYYDGLAKHGIKIGPYKNKSNAEIKSLGQVLYVEYFNKDQNSKSSKVHQKGS